MYAAPQELLDRLSADDCTSDDVYEFLEGQADELERGAEGRMAPSPGAFFNGPDDLIEYRKACAWWPKKEIVPELPWGHVCPSLFNLCWAYHEQDPAIGATFLARLVRAANRVAAWLEAQGIDPRFPNEAPEDRKTRLSKIKKKRMHPDSQVKELYVEYLAACARRKDAYELASTEVNSAHEAWLEAKALSQTPDQG